MKQIIKEKVHNSSLHYGNKENLRKINLGEEFFNFHTVLIGHLDFIQLLTNTSHDNVGFLTDEIENIL